MNNLNLNDKPLFVLVIRLWIYLDRIRKFQLIGLFVLFLISSFAELVSLASLVPFLGVLINPDRLFQYSYANRLYDFFNLSSADDLILLFFILFILTILFAAFVKLLTNWYNFYFAGVIGSDLSCESFRRTIYQNYDIHIARNSSELISSITTDIGKVIGLILKPILVLFSSFIILITLIIGFLLFDWRLALGCFSSLSLFYGIAFYITRNPLKLMSKEQVRFDQKLFKILQESFGSIADILLDNNQQLYYKRYQSIDEPYRFSKAKSTFFALFPKLVIEPFSMILIATIGYLLIQTEDSVRSITILGALALGAQRILPLSQSIYQSWAQVQTGRDSLINIIYLLEQPIVHLKKSFRIAPFNIQNKIELVNVSFSYSTKSPLIIKGINLEIFKGERIGIVGATGSGKSTFVNILMGLLKPSSGQLFVDGLDINESLFPDRLINWRSSIAHIPQNIYLADCSIAENIAFGINEELVDFDRVKLAAKKANISSFIDSTNFGYQTFVGERGIQLSGGQRQRIGIARALYKKASLLIMDEATSALDTITEKAVMDSIDSLDGDLTIITIAHRTATLSRCDRIINLQKGNIEILSSV